MRVTTMRAVVAATAVTLVLGAGTVQSAGAQISKRAPVDVPSKKKPKATTTTAARKTGAVPDACKLLTLAEVKPLVPTATDGKPVAQSGPVAQATCRWEGQTLDDSSDIVVSVVALPASAALVKASLAGDAKDYGKQVSGVGDFAIVKSVIPGDAEVDALVGKYLLTVDYGSSFTATATARDRQDEVVAVAKIAAGRM